MTTKKCRRCGEEKPLDKFPYLQKLRVDGTRGHMAECKACKSERTKTYLRAKKAKQAFPLLSPAYWNTGAAKRVYEELGLKWQF